MKKVLCIIMLLCIGVAVVGCGQKQSEIQNVPIKQENIDNANLFVDLLEQKDFGSAAALFDEEMSKLMPASKLQQTWEDLNKQMGDFEKKLEIKTEIQKEYEIAHVISQFKKVKLDIKVVFNQAGKISGLWFQPAK